MRKENEEWEDAACVGKESRRILCRHASECSSKDDFLTSLAYGLFGFLFLLCLIANANNDEKSCDDGNDKPGPEQRHYQIMLAAEEDDRRRRRQHRLEELKRQEDAQRANSWF